MFKKNIKKVIIFGVLFSMSGLASAWSFSPVKEARKEARSRGMGEVVTTCSWELFDKLKKGQTHACGITGKSGRVTIRIKKVNTVRFAVVK